MNRTPNEEVVHKAYDRQYHVQWTSPFNVEALSKGRKTRKVTKLPVTFRMCLPVTSVVQLNRCLIQLNSGFMSITMSYDI